MEIDINVKRYMSKLAYSTKEELHKEWERKLEQIYVFLSSSEYYSGHFLNSLWQLEMVRIIIRKKEYDKLSKQEKEEKLDYYKRMFEKFINWWIDKVDSSYNKISTTEMFEIIMAELDIVSFVIEFTKNNKYQWIHIMPFAIRQAFFMIAILEYDCKIFSD